jgi:hypothetical protein
VRGADRILVFQNGRVVEEGRHGELKAAGGVYARLNAVSEGVESKPFHRPVGGTRVDGPALTGWNAPIAPPPPSLVP